MKIVWKYRKSQITPPLLNKPLLSSKPPPLQGEEALPSPPHLLPHPISPYSSQPKTVLINHDYNTSCGLILCGLSMCWKFVFSFDCALHELLLHPDSSWAFSRYVLVLYELIPYIHTYIRFTEPFVTGLFKHSYCAFHEHANSEVQKPTDDCIFRCRQSPSRTS